MKRGGILHPALSHLLASTGHTDYLTICDRGFPVPAGPERIDLALTDDLPTVLDVLRAVYAEWSIDRVLITDEMAEVSPARVNALRELLGDVPLERLSHLEPLVRGRQPSCRPHPPTWPDAPEQHARRSTT